MSLVKFYREIKKNNKKDFVRWVIIREYFYGCCFFCFVF